MRRTAVLAILLLTAGAAPPYPPYAFVQPLSPPPAQRAQSNWSNYTPAPVPNPDAENPADRSSGPSRTELSPGLWRPQKGYQGDGFTPGSTVQGEQTRRYPATPQLNLNVPLE